MKSAFQLGSSVAPLIEARRGYIQRVLAALRMLKGLAQKQGKAFSAIALAEAGDTEGAIELLERAAGKRSSSRRPAPK